MIVFNPDNKETLTYGECLKPAMEITNPCIASQYLDDYVAYIQRKKDEGIFEGEETPLEVARLNLGYFAGYYSKEVQDRVNRLFDTYHPIYK